MGLALNFLPVVGNDARLIYTVHVYPIVLCDTLVDLRQALGFHGNDHFRHHG